MKDLAHYGSHKPTNLFLAMSQDYTTLKPCELMLSIQP